MTSPGPRRPIPPAPLPPAAHQPEPVNIYGLQAPPGGEYRAAPAHPGHIYAQQLPPQITVSPNITVVASPSMSQSITIERRRPRHGFHLIMTLLTGGLWGLCVWLPIAILRRGH